MELWSIWMDCVQTLRPACARTTTFFWMIISLIGMTIRVDMAGVSSFIRALGLQGYCYDRLLDFFHSPALNLEVLTELWIKLVLKIFPNLLCVNSRLVLVGDGLKIPKEGRKMPGVKFLHQESQSNTKPEYIMGHSCQVVALLVGALESFFAVPLAARIHEGCIFSNGKRQTLLEKMICLVRSLKVDRPFYFVADAYYANRTIIWNLRYDNNHLITRIKPNGVAWIPEPKNNDSRAKIGRPKIYAKKIQLRSLFKDLSTFETAQSPIYGEKNVQIFFKSMELYWRHVGIKGQYVMVVHPTRGRIIILSTDMELQAIEIIRLYGLRYKIELSFKNSLHVIGAYAYHFWVKCMKKISYRSGDQYLHREPFEYRKAVKNKILAYHRHIQLGLIAQGLSQYLSCVASEVIWNKFGSWLRTIRPGIPPSEQVTNVALRNCFPEFLLNPVQHAFFKKFFIDRVDFSRTEGIRLTGYGGSA